jgi:hypothetical protein
MVSELRSAVGFALMSECCVSLLALNIALVVAVSAAASSSAHGEEQPVFAKVDVGFASGPAAGGVFAASSCHREGSCPPEEKG